MFCYCVDMTSLVEDLISKWRDVKDTADEWLTENLADEILDDLRELLKDLKKHG